MLGAEEFENMLTHHNWLLSQGDNFSGPSESEQNVSDVDN